MEEDAFFHFSAVLLFAKKVTDTIKSSDDHDIIIYKHLRIVKGHHTIRRRSCSVLLFFLQQIKRTIKIFQVLKSVYHLPLEAYVISTIDEIDSNSNNIKWITLTENIQKIALGENLVDNVETYSCFDLY
ncbi:LOW QUALITY PROTEIN: hypothetical protein V1478_002198 [Vespula squamosa]|uniref:Uncharacterized protein n=1 Tax=Vespula squamosa TaxID=30214 RepID=A0ABD2BW74_VESSQ